MSATSWPTVLIEFDPVPAMDAWEQFSALAAIVEGFQGLAEAAGGAGPARQGAPPSARLFFEATTDEVLAELEAYAANSFAPGSWRLRAEALPDENWIVKWREYFHTARVGERLYVGPPWEPRLPVDAPADAILILINPGQAFGTGTHETTRLCMRLLEREPLAGRCLLDVGTGSGILCFAALRLGAAHGLGVEYDPVCEENFYENADLNRVRGHVRFILSDDPAKGAELGMALGSPKPDLAVCNMLCERFLPLLPSLRRLGVPVLLSGFLLEERARVLEACAANGFAVHNLDALGEWGAAWVTPA
jgi:ribosomal protein L11 methyltransferase